MFLYTLICNVNILRFASTFKDSAMRINLGTPDRIVRIIIGAVLVLLPFVSGMAMLTNPVWLWASMMMGAVLIFTALVRFCPLYAILGLSTCKVS